MNVKVFLLTALLSTASTTAFAGFTLDCGQPADQSTLSGPAPLRTSESYRVEFRDLEVVLHVVSPDGSEKVALLRPYYLGKNITQFFPVNTLENSVGSLSVLHNENGYFININGFARPSKWHAECK